MVLVCTGVCERLRWAAALVLLAAAIGCGRGADRAAAGRPVAAAPPAVAAPAFDPAIRPYVDFLRDQKTGPVDYVMRLFDRHDIVILCERMHPEWTQYELVARIVRDPRFVHRVGHVFTEVGTSSLRPHVARLLQGPELGDQQLLGVYRDMADLWPNANFGELLRQVHALNLRLPPHQRVMVYPSGMPFDWQGMTAERYRAALAALPDRDRVMAEQIIETVRGFRGRTKALVIMNYRHAFRPFPDGDKGDNVGRYLHEAFPGRVANVLLNQMHPTLFATDRRAMFAPISEGKWDAAFAVAGDRAVGFDLASSPFGSDHFDFFPFRLRPATYEQMFTGFVFYLPLARHRMVVGLPGLLADGFAATLDARLAIAGEPPLTAEQRAELETRRTLTYADYNPAHWTMAQEQIARWLRPARTPAAAIQAQGGRCGAPAAHESLPTPARSGKNCVPSPM